MMNELSAKESDRPILKMGQIEHIEIYRNRLIEIRRSPEDEEFYRQSLLWQGFYRKVSDRTYSDDGQVYDSPQECLEATRKMVAWEVDEEILTTKLQEVIHKLEFEGYTKAAILNALANLSCQAQWGNEVTQCLDEAASKAHGYLWKDE